MSMDEFKFIERLAEIANRGNYASSLEPFIGIGDDAAYVPISELGALFATDAMVDGVHFDGVHSDWFSIGWKAVIANQSDIAAMGGTPSFAVVTIGISPMVKADEALRGFKGIQTALEQFGGRCVGGDTVASPTTFLNVAMLGIPASREEQPAIMRRDSAKAGDQVAVTGSLGASAAGLEFIRSMKKHYSPNSLTKAHLTPVPRVEAGLKLAEIGVRCAIDVSDGLVADIEKIAIASGLSIIVKANEVPINSAVAKLYPERSLELALTGGEDYELVFVAPPELMAAALHSIAPLGKRIGEVTNPIHKGLPRVVILDEYGKEKHLKQKGWSHRIG